MKFPTLSCTVHIEEDGPERMKNGNSDLLWREQIDALGDWFHSLDLAGIPTAPNHFLADLCLSKL